MEDISFYKNISDDYFYLSPKERDLEKEMETHSSILAWTIPWTEKPGGLQSMGSTWLQSKELDRTERLTHTRTHKEGDYVPETGLGNPLIREALDTGNLTG